MSVALVFQVVPFVEVLEALALSFCIKTRSRCRHQGQFLEQIQYMNQHASLYIYNK